MSTTGKLTTGATVYYVLENSIEQSIQLPEIILRKGTNNITAKDGAVSSNKLFIKYVD